MNSRLPKRSTVPGRRGCWRLPIWSLTRSCSSTRSRPLPGAPTVGVPRPRGPLGRRVSVAACPSPDGSSARASAKGGEARRPETGVREVGIPRPSCSSRAQVGCACSRGVTSVHAGEGSERPQESACLVLVPARPTLSKRALVLPFIGVRRGSRCTMGGVAECYVSSGGGLAP
jgi:hypothetical protein